MKEKHPKFTPHPNQC